MAMTPSNEIPPTHNQPPLSAKARGLALARIVLGIGQIIGATVSLILLLQTGVNGLSVSATVFTGLLTLASKLVFRSGRKTHSDCHL